MPFRKSFVALSAGLIVSGSLLAGCGHKPIDTTKVFNIESELSSAGFETKTKGPQDVDPKMLGPQKMPNGVQFEPDDCKDYALSSGRPPKGLRGKMSVVTAVGGENQFVTVAIQAEKPIEPALPGSDECKHVTFGVGQIQGLLEEVESPELKGAVTTGTRSEITIHAPDGREASRESYNFGAYFGDWMVAVNASPVAVKGQPPAPVDADRARQILADAVAALKA